MTYDEVHHSLPVDFGKMADLASASPSGFTATHDYRRFVQADSDEPYTGVRESAPADADFRIAPTTSAAVLGQQLGRVLRQQIGEGEEPQQTEGKG